MCVWLTIFCDILCNRNFDMCVVILNVAKILADMKTQIKNNICLVQSADGRGRPRTSHDCASVLCSNWWSRRTCEQSMVEVTKRTTLTKMKGKQLKKKKSKNLNKNTQKYIFSWNICVFVNRQLGFCVNKLKKKNNLKKISKIIKMTFLWNKCATWKLAFDWQFFVIFCATETLTNGRHFKCSGNTNRCENTNQKQHLFGP